MALSNATGPYIYAIMKIKVLIQTRVSVSLYTINTKQTMTNWPLFALRLMTTDLATYGRNEVSVSVSPKALVNV